MIALPRLGPTANDNVDVTHLTLVIALPSFVLALVISVLALVWVW